MTAAFAAGQIVGPLLAAWAARLGASLPQTLAAGAALLALSAWGWGKSRPRAAALGIMQWTRGARPLRPRSL